MNNQEPRKPRSAAVSVKIQPNTYGTLRKMQEELSSSMGGVKLSLSQTIAIVVIEHGIARKKSKTLVDVPSMKDEDYTIPQYGQKSWKPYCSDTEGNKAKISAVFSVDEVKHQWGEMDEDAAAEAAWREIQEEEAGRIAAQEREWAEDEGRDPAELTSIDVLGKR